MQAVTRAPTVTPRPVQVIPTTSPTPTVTPYPTVIPVPTATPAVWPDTLSLGESANGNPIRAYRVGDGSRALLLVGGVHAGTEGNTVALMNQLLAHIEANPDAIDPDLMWWIVPALNPDGLQSGSRFNGNGVDLNRNWGCGWHPDAVWSGGAVDAGDAAMSEPETQHLAAFILQLRPEAVVFYHSAADGVFAGDCPGRGGAWTSSVLEATYARAAGYSYGAAFSAYPVTGTAPNWVDGLGIPSVDVELSSHSDPQFERNLRAVLAVQCWLVGCEP